MKRLPAEWEPQSFIQFTFPRKDGDWSNIYDDAVQCFAEIINTVAQYEDVLVVCDDPKEVRSTFAKKNKFPIKVVQVQSNDSWARDHGPITILDKERPLIQDFIFNGWGGKYEADYDNRITHTLIDLGVFGAIDYLNHNFILEGGSIEPDGQGTLLTTSQCLLSKERNNHLSKTEIESYLSQHLGIRRTLWLDHGHLVGDDTDGHVDTLARFCDASTIAYVKCDDSSDEHYYSLKDMEDELKSFKTPDGEPYRLVPLPMPEACYASDGHRLPATYANFLIINDAVLVPTYGVRQDEVALSTLAKLFPNRTVIGINCRALIEQHGSLHCITMQYPASVKLNLS